MAQEHPVIVRTSYGPKSTLGRIALPGGRTIYTLERPWVPNPEGPGGMHDASCVPDGDYTLRPHISAKYPAPGVWILWNQSLGVYQGPADIPPAQPWGRFACLIHPANKVRELLGCTAVGMELAVIDGEDTALRSREALELLRGWLGSDDNHVLTIRPTAGTRERA
jgi:hypothetical protein